MDELEGQTTGSWVGNTVPNAPEDYGRVFFTLPFCYRLRFVITPHPNQEATLVVYEDVWSNESRCWKQFSTIFTLLLSSIQQLMKLVEEELAK